jgi:hypothetical protein
MADAVPNAHAWPRLPWRRSDGTSESITCPRTPSEERDRATECVPAEVDAGHGGSREESVVGTGHRGSQPTRWVALGGTDT